MKFRQLKEELRQSLLDSEPDSIIDRFGSTQGIFRALTSLLFDSDPLVIWRSAEVIGRVAGFIYPQDSRIIREQLRRFFWMMNDESGNLCRNVPEAIGEILFNVPDLIDEYGLVLASFVNEEPFETGVRLAIARVAVKNKKPFLHIVELLYNSLDDASPDMRGSTMLALQTLDEQLPKTRIENLTGDDGEFSLYDFETRAIRNLKISDLVSN